MHTLTQRQTQRPGQYTYNPLFTVTLSTIQFTTDTQSQIESK